MKCTFTWCSEVKSPAIGIANLRGIKGYPTAETYGQYPLCKFHFEEAMSDRWKSVIVEGWESFPQD